METWIYGLIGAASVIAAALIISVLLQLCVMLKTKICKPILPYYCPKGKESKKCMRGHVASFSVQEVEEISEGFINHIGEGTSNHVFKGILSDGTEVAIKRIKDEVAHSSDVDASFKFQADLLSRVCHQHLVNLVGFCEEENQRMLLFQYAPNGTLYENLHGDEHLTWKQRIRLVVGAAYGLAYLHQSCNPPVIHGDLRSRNILLTEDNAAKIAGLGKVPIAASSELAVVRKLGGHVDPEMIHKGVYSRAGDVYSFGVLLLEILSGRLAFSEETGMLVEWARDFLESRDRMEDLTDPSLKNVSPLELYSLCEIARLCIQHEASSRPCMRDILAMLKQTLAISAETAAPVSSPVTLRGLMEG
ncbi:hypothetical protein O6H91_12G019300 [Diphasiastrum complanatum]|uniref:Uncharacterized protein n=6 Tax=Diphasiastrum complanatum TaxID=34168 RepID=A0ACC2C007_DIPCM|nr:hypothetical protein O6H91_12G019300 [Diphasiastrum complanatum]KAJ7535130.1 hypothetical protein O6H91_12G019300 [Diphasiastrum complanatum]KAJ7535131.1 hypothetical protein O6H91_12G019300 [Diphasiastrum complanatum]KAJ7535132.1 hypothetical protein O6H91_12G019300 [Diphasiastrum complanatum]KAJ7535133.1 hypothetical protein O6H91_12G019300 [Diphasiastrum complanatum]